jgi:MFS family permease
MSETVLGRRGAATVATLIGVLVIPLYVFATSAALLWTGALAMGFFGAGNFGIVPAYLTERFPTVARAVGAGFAYHVGAGFGSFTPTLVGALSDRGLPSRLDDLCIRGLADLDCVDLAGTGNARPRVPCAGWAGAALTANVRFSLF